MSVAETIQAAIDKLEAQRAAATSAPWHCQEYDHNPGDEGVPILGGGEEGTMTEHLFAYAYKLGGARTEAVSVADAELIVTLHRTIDAQLSILRHALARAKSKIETGGNTRSVWSHERDAENLALAILGGEVPA